MQHVIFSDVLPNHNQQDIRLCVSRIRNEWNIRSDFILILFEIIVIYKMRRTDHSNNVLEQVDDDKLVL
jgi:hypothetical protein